MKNFFNIKEAENNKAFKGLVKMKLFEKKSKSKGSIYALKLFVTSIALKRKINNNELNYNILSVFFQDENNDKME